MRAVSGATRAGIVDAGARCIIRDGVAHATMAVIAAECGVSKALLHYHFAHRAALLSEAAMLLGRRLVTRERRALEHANAKNAIDELWRWLHREIERGELRALLELATVREPALEEVIVHIDAERRATTGHMVTALFTRLRLTPRVESALIAGAVIAFVNGLATGGVTEDARTSFDVFWLAMLSLGE